MATFLTLHQAPGLSVDELSANAPDVAASVHARFLNLYVNLSEGFIVSVYEAADMNAVEQEFERIGFPFVEIHEIDYLLDADRLAAVVAGTAT